MGKAKYTLPILAIFGLLLGVLAVCISDRRPPTPPLPFPPPEPPFEHSIAGAGKVEAASEDVNIGTPISEIVTDVYVEGGDCVVKGTPLFKVNTSILEAEKAEAEANVAIAQASYDRLLAQPRKELVPIELSKVRAAEANYLDHLTRYELVEKVENPKAVSRDEFYQRKYGSLYAKYQLDEAQENLTLLLAGAWSKDLDISRAELVEAQAKVKTVETRIALSTIRAPFDGQVLRVNVRIGEFAQSWWEHEVPMLIFGSIHPLHIRVDIDEEDVWRVREGAPGVAFVRGNSSIHVPLEFVRIEPFMVPKLSLTGDNTERVDVRVLQIIYRFDRGDLPIFPGEVMDIFLEGRPS